MGNTLRDKTVVVVGRGTGIARAVKRDYFKHIADGNPARRIGTTDEIAGAVLFAMTNSFMTGMTLKVDGGEPLV